MQLNITEIDETFYDDDYLQEQDYQQFQSEIEYEKIPENIAPIKVIKKGVHFDNSIPVQKPMHQSIPKQNAKFIRPQTPIKKPKISYEDILSKMGMLVSDGKLHLLDRNTLTPQQQKETLSSNSQYQQQPIDNKNIPNNSYIYNKYFKDEVQPDNTVRKPRTLHEYKMMLVDDYLKRQRIKHMKSTKLMMPTSNINISNGNSANLNKLFNFSKR